MSEKVTEIFLEKLLEKFPKNNIYYTHNSNETLKNIFKNASKTGCGIGIPDRIYFNEKDNILIIFECKYDNINKAISDLKIYKNKICVNQNIQVFYIAVVNNNYKIFNYDFKVIDKIFSPNIFNINLCDTIHKYNKSSMSNDIHKIHNYIRDYTKISNEDKGFFIACILISFKKESFNKIIENYNSKEYLYDIIKQTLIDFEIDFTIFEFLRKDENNKHFLNIINLVKSIYVKNPSIDLLNMFYSEFVKYNNTDSKSLGIVLTPDHIVKLMIELLDINTNDVFLDLCCGTGSLSLDAIKKNPKYIINCEYQNKLYTLMKCNMILRDINLTTNLLIKGDCFNQKFKATKSAINPPYGMKDKKELDFVIKQLESIDKDGLICAIIPCSNFSNNEKRNILFKKSTIIKIIICNNNLFYPTASIKTCIVLIKNTPPISLSYEILLDNYEDDGFIIKKCTGRIKTSNGNYTSYKKIISIDDESWINHNITKKINLNNLKNTFNEINYQNLKLENMNNNLNNFNCISDIKEYKITDLFYILKKPKTPYTLHKKVFEISAKNNNNGIKGYCDSNTNTFTGNKIVLITGGDGGAGLAYYQEKDFSIISATTVLSPINEKIKLDKYIGIYIAEELSKYKQKYSRGFTWNMKRIRSDTINIPVINNDINYNYIKSLFN